MHLILPEFQTLLKVMQYNQLSCTMTLLHLIYIARVINPSETQLKLRIYVDKVCLWV